MRRLISRAASYEQRSTDGTARRMARKIARGESRQRVRGERELIVLGDPRPQPVPRYWPGLDQK